MSGQKDLSKVLHLMRILCDEIEYGFATVSADHNVNHQEVIGLFKESEGLTIIATTKYFAANKISFEGPYAKLTIDLHTSLELLGLTAELTTRLSSRGMAANVVAAYFHDHIFVQYDLRQQAMEALNEQQIV